MLGTIKMDEIELKPSQGRVKFCDDNASEVLGLPLSAWTGFIHAHEFRVCLLFGRHSGPVLKCASMLPPISNVKVRRHQRADHRGGAQLFNSFNVPIRRYD